ncbi:MAG: hypothetical protein FJY76_03695, partial [Candidatus Aenigmarchaeota archaeon]|nr:hypothetical protein [Candidatus Aenigmarchaeota archaeon]
MKRKAVANGIMLLMLILVGIYELYYVSAITMSGVRVSVKRYQEDMYALQNSLIAAKEYMKTAERYAVYQACYDNLKNGGWPDAVAPDSAKKDVGGAEYYFTIPENGFAEELGKSIAAGMNNYTSGGYTFMGAYSVSLPAYSEARITSHDASKMSVAATAGAPLSITRYVEVAKVGEGFLQLKGEAKEQNIMEKITLKKDSGIYQDVETPCFDLYERGAAYSETLSNLLNMQLNDEISGLLDD